MSSLFATRCPALKFTYCKIVPSTVYHATPPHRASPDKPSLSHTTVVQTSNTTTMARGKKKHRPTQKIKQPTTPSSSSPDTTATTTTTTPNPPAVKREDLTTEQELALEAKAQRKAEKAAKAAERARKKQEKAEIAAMPGPTHVTLRHVLIKHSEARNSFSKRTLMDVDKTKTEATGELNVMLRQLKGTTSTKELEELFASLALQHSDCGTHASGGKLDVQRKQMHVNFENVAWGLAVGELGPNVVETESGCHILLRLG